MIEHCVSSLRKWQRDLLYKVYVTDFLKNICGSNETPRFYDLAFSDDKSQKMQEKQETAEDIISRITNNMRDM